MNINNRTAILIVDDQESNLIAIKQTLEDLNVPIIVAESGKEALELLAQHKFAVILVDLMMPQMNGFELAEKIRQNKYHAQIPIIFMTASNYPQIPKYGSYRQGIVDFLFMPIDPYFLKSKVQMFLDATKQKRTSKQSLDSLYEAKEPPSVLVVDDNAANTFAMQTILEGMPLKLYTASSGSEALQLLLRHDFALVLMDAQMPEMDGFETAALMQKNKLTKEVPIIFVTAINKDEKYIRQGFAVGAADYLLKPLDPVILQSKIMVFLNFYLQKKAMQNLVSALNTSQKVLNKENVSLHQLAHTDFLTGLENRLQFEELITEFINYAKQANKVLTLMLLDLDNFKKVNDTLGHQSGDDLLKQVAYRLNEVVKNQHDANHAKSEWHVFRLGGDEFAILLVDTWLQNIVKLLADALIASLSQVFLIQNTPVFIGVSIGIAFFPASGFTSEALIKSADAAMYHAKTSGKNQYKLATTR